MTCSARHRPLPGRAPVAHLDHFIIMDDVELHPLDETNHGNRPHRPRSRALLDSSRPHPIRSGPMQLRRRRHWQERPSPLVHAYSVLVPRFELWFAPEDRTAVWNALTTAGAAPIGIRRRRSPPHPRRNSPLRHRHHRPPSAPGNSPDPRPQLHQGLLPRPGDRRAHPLPRDRASQLCGSFQVDGATPSPFQSNSIPARIHRHRSANSPASPRSTSPEFHGTVAIGSIRTEAIERKASTRLRRRHRHRSRPARRY